MRSNDDDDDDSVGMGAPPCSVLGGGGEHVEAHRGRGGSCGIK